MSGPVGSLEILGWPFGRSKVAWSGLWPPKIQFFLKKNKSENPPEWQ